jgi:hypothetical protein
MKMVIGNISNHRYIISFIFYIQKKWNIVFSHSIEEKWVVEHFLNTASVTLGKSTVPTFLQLCLLLLLPDFFSMNPILPLANNNLLNNHMHTLLLFMRFGFTFLISLTFKIIAIGHRIIPTMFVRCHCIKLKLVLGLRRRIIGPILFNATITLLRSQRFLNGPFMNQLDDVVLTNGYFQQDSTTAQKTRFISVGLWSRLT